MRILHYMMGIPPVRGGGMVRYATDLMRAESRLGEDVCLLVPGKIPGGYRGEKIRIRAGGKYAGIPFCRVYNPLPVPMGNGIMDTERYMLPCDADVYRDFLGRLCPDVVHVHSLMGIHREFFTETRRMGIPVVFTTHDYFGLCPTVNLYNGKHVCGNLDWGSCGFCCGNAYSEGKLRLEQSGCYRIYRGSKFLVGLFHGRRPGRLFPPPWAPKMPEDGGGGAAGKPSGDYSGLKNYYDSILDGIDCFHFNSSQAEQIFRSRVKVSAGRVIPVSHAGIRDRRSERTYGERLRLGFLGTRSVHKGFFQLTEVLDRMYGAGFCNMELHVYFDGKKGTDRYVRNHGRFSPQGLEEVMNRVDAVVVPSQWPETFGLVVLEALSFGVPVILSDNVGAKDLLSDCPGVGFVYDGSAEGLERLLERIYRDRGLLKRANRNILEMDYNFSYENHVERILELYDSMVRECGRGSRA